MQGNQLSFVALAVARGGSFRLDQGRLVACTEAVVLDPEQLSSWKGKGSGIHDCLIVLSPNSAPWLCGHLVILLGFAHCSWVGVKIYG